jgi:OmcA/MtrC family decaheme c-type cytochrome
MRLINRGLVVAMAAGALALPIGRPSPRNVDPRGPGAAQAKYGPQSVEHYLSVDDFIYVRPGYNIKVNSVTIGSDNRPLVDVSFTDDAGQPLDRTGVITPGALSASMILAWYDPGTRNYTSYTTRVATAAPPSKTPGVTAIQAAADSGGTWTDLEVGHSQYKFKTALPAGFDKTKTTTLGIYGTRSTSAIIGKNYFAKNVEYDFRPDGGTIAAASKWGEFDPTSTSCNKCHDPIGAHGGSRMDVKLCVLCHSPQTTDPDTGNTVDMKVMIHKIHYGENLPSVKAGTPYVIIGNAQSVNDFSTVALPQDIRNCQVCHAPSANAPDSAAWMTNPSRAACGSCHDDVNFATGTNHPAGAQPDDSACASCHKPVGSKEFDAGIDTAHTVPTRSAQLKGLNSKIVSVTNTAPGQKPTVTFQITNGDGSAVNPKDLGSNLNLLLGGPTSDYAIDPFRERADGAAFDGTTATYTFTNAIPASAKGTWAVTIEARRTVTLNPAPKQGPTSVTEGAFNPVAYVAVTDATPQARRAVVDMAKCNNCHDQLALHGGQRFNVFECAMCHNPNASDVSRRPADKAPVESIDFKRMIHRIHSGEELTQDFTVYGFGGSVNNFNEVRYPGDRRDCLQCHVAGAYTVAEIPPANRLSTATPRDYFTPQGPTAAACLGCHDDKAPAAHAFTATSPFGEACAACHGTDSQFSVDKVHAR